MASPAKIKVDREIGGGTAPTAQKLPRLWLVSPRSATPVASSVPTPSFHQLAIEEKPPAPTVSSRKQAKLPLEVKSWETLPNKERVEGAGCSRWKNKA